jgi:hypothetical protein
VIAVVVAQTVTVTVPPGQEVTIRTNIEPPMIQQLRDAVKSAAIQEAPWTQRFIAIQVEADARNRTDRSGLSVFSTNYVVTFIAAPRTSTNAPLARGANEAGTFQIEITMPVRVGDKFIFFPTP